MKVSYIVHNKYEDNPFAQYCINKMKGQKGVETELLQLSDLGDYVERCNHSKEFYEKFGNVSYVTDQVRLLLGKEIKDFCYLDADAFVKDIIKVPDNTIGLEAGRINNGALQKSAPEWCDFYFDVYQKNWKNLIYSKDGKAVLNYDVIKKYPCTVPLNYLEVNDIKHTNGRHFVISNFGRFAKYYEDNIIYYCFDNKWRPGKEERIYWQLADTPNEVGNFLNRICYFDLYGEANKSSELFYIWQKQMEYSLGRHLIFVEI